jgi:MFS family permease
VVPLAVDPPSAPYTAFTSRQRILIITIASLSATFSGFASNIYFPAIPTMASALHTSVENINLTVTTYMIFQAISPTLWA